MYYNVDELLIVILIFFYLLGHNDIPSLQPKEKKSPLSSLEFKHRNILGSLSEKTSSLKFQEFLQEILSYLNYEQDEAKCVLSQAFHNILNSDNISEAIQAISKSLFCHYMNSDILHVLARATKNDTSIKEAQAYETRLNQIYQEIHVEEFLNFNEAPQATEDTSIVYVKKNERWERCYLITVMDTVKTVCKLGRIPPFLCRIKSIKRGSVAVEFLIPKCLAQDTKQHLSNQKESLHVDHSIDQLFIDNVNIVNQFYDEVQGSILLSCNSLLYNRFKNFLRKDRVQISHYPEHHRKFCNIFVLIIMMLMTQAYTALKSFGIF